MRTAFIGFHLFAVVLLAGDPPYFADPIDGYYLPDLVAREKVQFVPGSLSGCKVTYTSPTYSTAECDLNAAELVLQTTAGKTMSFPFIKLYVTEYQYDPNEPSILSYSLQGMYGEALPNGTLLEAQTSFFFERNGKTPNALRGRFTLSTLNIGGAVYADLTQP